MKNVQELLHIKYTVTSPLISKLINVVNKYIIGTSKECKYLDKMLFS